MRLGACIFDCQFRWGLFSRNSHPTYATEGGGVLVVRYEGLWHELVLYGSWFLSFDLSSEPLVAPYATLSYVLNAQLSRMVHGVGDGGVAGQTRLHAQKALNVTSLALKIQGRPQASSSMEPYF